MSWFPWLDGFDLDPVEVATTAAIALPPTSGAANAAREFLAVRKRQEQVDTSNQAVKIATDAVNDANTLYNTKAGGATGGGPTGSYADAPGAGTLAAAPKILGYEDYPGEIPASNVAMYNSTMPFDEWRDMSKKEKIAAKEALYAAGYYGKSDVPVMNNSVTTADRDAIAAAMADANLSQSGDWKLTAGAAAEVGTNDAAKAAKQEARQRAAARATAITSLRGFAYDNGIRLPEDFIAKKANQIAAGVKGADEVTNQLTERFVARQYPALADDLKAGLTVREAAAPYISAYAQLLEVPDSQVDLHDPLLKKALQGVNDKGEPAYTPLWKFEEEVKQDKRWQHTDNAWEEVGSQAFEVMRMFGMQA